MSVLASFASRLRHSSEKQWLRKGDSEQYDSYGIPREESLRIIDSLWFAQKISAFEYIKNALGWSVVTRLTGEHSSLYLYESKLSRSAPVISFTSFLSRPTNNLFTDRDFTSKTPQLNIAQSKVISGFPTTSCSELLNVAAQSIAA